MLFHYRLLISIGFKVKLPMILEVDNKGAKDLSNNWSVGGRLRHIDVLQFFLHDLKEDGRIVLQWISTDDNSSEEPSRPGLREECKGTRWKRRVYAAVSRDRGRLEGRVSQGDDWLDVRFARRDGAHAYQEDPENHYGPARHPNLC
jgi:hypothetical protein